jgi:AraC-like DNA-binding protein
MMPANENLAEIAHSCGFCSQSYYTKILKLRS